MDPTAADGSHENLSSPPVRSTPGSRVAYGGDQFASNLDITASPRSIPPEVTQSASSSPQHYPSNAYLSPPAAHQAYLPAPSSQPYSSYPVLTPSVLNSDWSHHDQSTGSTPSYRLESQGGPASHSLPSRPRQTEGSSSMSTVALQFDPSFSMGSRSAFAWPGHLESNSSGNTMLGHDLSSMGPGSEPSMTPPNGPRSLTSSPPRSSLTTEQRELKRQQDKVRRDSRLSTRMRRTSSQSYVESPPPPSMAMSDVSGSMSLPVYTTAPASMPLLSEPPTTMSAPSYLSSYSTSSMDDQHQSHPSHVYPNSYQQNIQPNYSMPMEYPGVYAGQQYGARPSALPVGQDVGLMYQVPAVMTSGGAGTQEGGHVRVVQSRPKPRCWEHGCNGRQFSTFSNLLRHQREKSGQAAKATCPNCGAEFTRTTARNGHLLHDKCKGRRNP